jgi:hypothetical protein
VRGTDRSAHAPFEPVSAAPDATRVAVRPPVPNDALVDEIVRRFPPDVPLRLGTSLFRVEAALRAFGVPFTRRHSGWLGRGGARCWEALAAHLSRGGRAIVCVDTGLLGGAPWAAHWAVAWRLDPAGIHLQHWSDTPVPAAEFRRAWACRHLPWPHHHAALLIAWGPQLRLAGDSASA